MSKAEVTPKQQRFIDHYCISLNAEQAGREVGYAKTYAQQLLAKPHIRDAIKTRQAAAFEGSAITPERVIEEIAAIALVDITEIYNDDGTIKPLRRWPQTARRAVSDLRFDSEGNIKAVAMNAKVRALEQLGKHFKLFVDVHEIKGGEEIGRRLAEIRRRKLGDGE